MGSNSNSKLLLAALAVGLVIVASAGVGREVVNARALAAQVEEADEARGEAEQAHQQIHELVITSAIAAARDLHDGKFESAVTILQGLKDTEDGRRESLREIGRLWYGDDADLSPIDRAIDELNHQHRDGP